MTTGASALIPRRKLLALFCAGVTAAALERSAFAAIPTPAGDADMTDIAGIANGLIGHGYFLMTAEWVLHEGNIEKAKAIIDQYRPHILAADGIKIFLAAQDQDNPNHILFYEAYETEAHYKAHAESEPFQRYIIREGLPLVAKRTLTKYTLL